VSGSCPGSVVVVVGGGFEGMVFEDMYSVCVDMEEWYNVV
jgi:hypothetical protein